MKSILSTLTLTLILGLSAGAAFAQPAIITQGASDTVLAFEAEHFAYVSNSLPTFWVVTNDVPATGTPASGGQALYQVGEPQSTGRSSSFAYHPVSRLCSQQCRRRHFHHHLEECAGGRLQPLRVFRRV